MASVPEWLPSLLENESFMHYNAYSENYKHNHKTHSIVALSRLGASKERVEKHCKWQNDKTNLVPYHDGEPIDQSIVADSLNLPNIDDYFGKNIGYYTILKHFLKIYDTVYGKDIEKMIASELPRTIDGPLPGAFHGLIQLGYGYAAKSPIAMVEGLAMNYHQYAPIYPDNPTKARDLSNFGNGKTDIVDIVKELIHRKDIVDKVYKNSEENRKLSPDNPFDWIARGILKYYTDKFVELTDSIKLPDWFDKDKQDMSQISQLVDWMLDTSAVFYVKISTSNDFFFLHGLSSSWTLKQVIHLLDFNTALLAIRAHLFTILAVYTSVAAPELSKTPEDYWKGDIVDQTAWDKVIADTIEPEWENHIFKVVQILYEQWKANPNSQYAKYYIAGARQALDYPLAIIPEGHKFGVPNMTMPNTA